MEIKMPKLVLQIAGNLTDLGVVDGLETILWMDSHVAQQCRRDRLRSSYYVEESPPGDLDRPAFSSVGLGDSVSARADNALWTSLMLCDAQSSLTYHRSSPSWKGDSNTPLALLPAYPESCVNVGIRLDSNAGYDKASNPDVRAIEKAIVVGINCGELRNTSLTLSSNLLIETGTQNDVAMVEQHLPADITISNKGIQDVTGIYTAIPCNSGPLGPFTGYASILKSSKFLKPAQQLLHEMCGVSDSFLLQTGNALERSSENLGFRADADVDTLNNGCSSGSLLPEYQQMKANLLYMQEEVCKRYRQYHQQMQMVFSSFHTVEGLNAATPYICFALETILRNFDFLKNAILYQLRQSKKSFGGELLFPLFGPGCDKRPPKVSKMKCLNRSFPKNKYSTSNQERVLRPQRGLPEHAVIILRAWLFEHFLHPYPTETDKHLLACQTGISRNQVSNWFINARVRVWKPMVEEIHKLETKHRSDPCKSSVGHEDQSTRGSDMHFQRLMAQGSEREWNRVIRVGGTSSQYPSNPEGAAMTDFTPTPCGGVDFREPGSESLALGLPRNVEFGQHQQ